MLSSPTPHASVAYREEVLDALAVGAEVEGEAYFP